MLLTGLEVDSLETEQLLERHAVFAYVHNKTLIDTPAGYRPPNRACIATLFKDRVLMTDGGPELVLATLASNSVSVCLRMCV